MKKPKCKLCGAKHWPPEPHTAHGAIFATTGVPHKLEPVVNSLLDASIGEFASNTASNSTPLDAPKQRWTRQAYNAYMRQYMTKRRAK